MDGKEAYDKTYSELFGARWRALKEALLQEPYHVARKNEFFFKESAQKVTDFADLGIGGPYDPLPGCYNVDERFELKNFDPTFMPFYKMDPASIVAARALNVQEGDRVLDMCAAPGGKTLVLIERIGAKGKLTANELSPKRRFRMMSVIKHYVPQDVRSQVDITGFDGSIYGLKVKDAFDRILLDAPCSGDRGLLQKSQELSEWTPKRPKNFAIRQYALLASAFMALKPGGTLVYSTCAISPFENDGVIDKLFKKKGGEFEIIPSESPLGEPTKHGRLILPDKDQAGPIYFCILKKKDE